MNDRDRLIELLEQHCLLRMDYLECTASEETKCSACLADHLISNGVIVPPCRVGNVVYQVDAERIYPSVVKAVIYDTDGIAFDERAIGKTVFLTREEAEAKLKEREL